MPTEHIFATGAEAASDIAARIATILSDAIAARGVATIAVSGGRSPRPVLEALSMAVASVADYRECPRLETPATPERVLMAVERLKAGG